MKRILWTIAAFCLTLSAQASVTLTINVSSLSGGTAPGAYVQANLQNCILPTIVGTGSPVPLTQNIYPVNGTAVVTLPDNVNQIACSGVQFSYYTFNLVHSQQTTFIKNTMLPAGQFNLANLQNITTPPFNFGIITGPQGPPGVGTITGNGTPTATGAVCAQPYGAAYIDTSVSPNGYYICGGTGWQTVGGGSGSLPTGTGLVAVNSGDGALATPAQVVGAQSFSYGSEFYGDSTPCSTGASATVSGNVSKSAGQNSYPGLLMPILGGDLANFCKSGDTEVDTNSWVFKHLDNEGVGSPNYFLEDFINDATGTNALNSGYQNSVKYGYQAQQAFAAIPRINKVFAQDAAVTTSGTWSNDTTSQTGWGISSTTSGSAFNCPAIVGADGHLIVWSFMADGNGGTWTGTIDSTPVTDPVTSSNTFTATGYGGTAIAGQLSTSQYVAYVFSGLSAGTHTFHGTVTSATNAANVVDFGGCAGLPAANVNLPQVFVAGVPYQNTGGAADSTTAAYNAIASTLVTSLAALPLNLSFVDVRNSLLNAPSCGNGVEATMFTNCYADFKHQNNTGYAAEVNTTTTGYAAVVTAVNPILTAGAIKNPRQGPMSVYPYVKPPVDTAHWFTFNGGAQNVHGNGAIFNCASAGQNCDGIGDLQNYGLSLVMAGNPFSLINCPGTVTPTLAANCTQFINASANGAMSFFGATNGTPYDYFTSNTTFFGGQPGYASGVTGMWVNGAPGTVSGGFASSVAATSGSNQNSNIFALRGNYWNGTINQPGEFRFQDVLGTGATPTQTLSLTCFYSTTACAFNASALASVALPASSTAGGSLICVASGANCPGGGGGGNTTSTGTNLFLPVFTSATAQTASVLSQDSTSAPTILNSSVAISAPSYTGVGATNGAITLKNIGTVAPSPSTGNMQISPNVAITTPYVLSPAAAAFTGLAYFTNTSNIDQLAQVTNTQLSGAIQTSLAALASCTTGTAYSPFSGTCISVGASIANYYTSGAFAGVGPVSYTPAETFDVYNATATTGITTMRIRAGAGQNTSLLSVDGGASNASPTTFNNSGSVTVGNGIAGNAGRSAIGGFGVPTVIADTLTWATNQTAAIATTTLFSTNAFPNAGNKSQSYRVVGNFAVVTGGAGSITLTVTWTDNVTSHTQTYLLNTATTGAYMDVDKILNATALSVATNVQYAIAQTGTATWEYNLYGLEID